MVFWPAINNIVTIGSEYKPIDEKLKHKVLNIKNRSAARVVFNAGRLFGNAGHIVIVIRWDGNWHFYDQNCDGYFCIPFMENIGWYVSEYSQANTISWDVRLLPRSCNIYADFACKLLRRGQFPLQGLSSKGRSYR